MGYKKYLWHLDIPEEENLLEAHYIHSLIDLAGRRIGKRYIKILDIPCGIGRHHKYLREYGFDVYGVDAEEELIQDCLERYNAYKDHYNVMDMRSLPYNNEFDVILNWYTSFGYFTNEENKIVLQNFYKALTKKGILIIDYPSYWSPMINASIHGDKYIELTELKETEKHRFQYKARLYKISNNYNKLTEVDELKMTITIYPPENLKNILIETGFKILYTFWSRSFRQISPEKLSLYNTMRSGIRRIVWLAYKP